MTETEVAVKLENHDQQIKSLKHRMDEQEEQSKTIQELVLSVKELALNMQTMIEVQGKQGDRLAKLEAEPAERWNGMQKTVFNTIVGAMAGAVATGLIYIMAQYAK
ncbi:hypothetical protein [[Clostridium] symbiosum]|uniref:hypothetical protein n=1 Tax=Clostridium symbiosum TaxID=1512 RepID=UPI00232DB8C7|nr:hypothetical protein [[Clostridium] symbiosum]MDB2011919.1 hypothetical protein [[Clostridium] symbiosum]MDB2029486.1 hypothetical protein [[Clostridium] symbiosum]